MFCIFAVSSLSACGRLSLFLYHIVDSMIFFSVFSVSDFKKWLKVGLILSSIELKNICQHFLNTNMEITTMHDIILFRLMVCAIVLFFGAT